MKRSDIIKHIKDSLLLNDIYKLSNTQAADTLLRVIESHGMKPPESSTIDLGLCNYPVYEWEEEDEEAS